MCTLSEGVSYHLGISKNCQQMLCWDLKIRKTWRVLTVHVLRVWSFLQTQDPLYNPKCPFTVLLIEVQSKQYTRLITPKNWLIITTIELKWTHTWEWDPSDQIKAPHVRSLFRRRVDCRALLGFDLTPLNPTSHMTHPPLVSAVAHLGIWIFFLFFTRNSKNYFVMMQVFVSLSDFQCWLKLLVAIFIKVHLRVFLILSKIIFSNNRK